MRQRMDVIEQLPTPPEIVVAKDFESNFQDTFKDSSANSSAASKNNITPSMSTSSNQDTPQQVDVHANDSLLSLPPQEELGIPVRNGNGSTPATRYTVSIRGTYGSEIESKEVPSPSQLGKSTLEETTQVSPLELIWPIHLAVESWADFEKNRGRSVPPVTNTGPYQLKINSPAVIAAIQNVIDVSHR
jgi:hypothetical protein